jgi:hypothetical protein
MYATSAYHVKIKDDTWVTDSGASHHKLWLDIILSFDPRLPKITELRLEDVWGVI